MRKSPQSRAGATIVTLNMAWGSAMHCSDSAHKCQYMSSLQAEISSWCTTASGWHLQGSALVHNQQLPLPLHFDANGQ